MVSWLTTTKNHQPHQPHQPHCAAVRSQHWRTSWHDTARTAPRSANFAATFADRCDWLVQNHKLPLVGRLLAWWVGYLLICLVGWLVGWLICLVSWLLYHQFSLGDIISNVCLITNGNQHGSTAHARWNLTVNSPWHRQWQQLATVTLLGCAAGVIPMVMSPRR